MMPNFVNAETVLRCRDATLIMVGSDDNRKYAIESFVVKVSE